MPINLGPEFEAAVIAAAGLAELNVEPGSLRIDAVADPVTTVRVTVVRSVPVEAVIAAGITALNGAAPPGEQQ